ncbi:hypothetical protein PSHT_12507, partial [Puccinia striiformis]
MDAWDADVLDAQFNSHRVPFRPPAIADIPENQQLRQQADVVIEGFRRLIAQCEFHSPTFQLRSRSRSTSLSVGRKKSELQVILKCWRDNLDGIDYSIKSNSQSGASARYNSRGSHAARCSIITNIQIIKAVFDKLSREGIHRPQARLSTAMSSHQLMLLNGLVHGIYQDIWSLMTEMRETIMPRGRPLIN